MNKLIQSDKPIIGGVERCNLPELGIYGLEVRVDTGAKTSSLHVDNIEKMDSEHGKEVVYDIHPDVYDIDRIVRCRSKLVKASRIKSSNGVSEKRYLIETQLQMGPHSWLIKLTLTDRAGMTYRMLLGREAMQDRVLVDPSRDFLISD